MRYIEFKGKRPDGDVSSAIVLPTFQKEPLLTKIKYIRYEPKTEPTSTFSLGLFLCFFALELFAFVLSSIFERIGMCSLHL